MAPRKDNSMKTFGFSKLLQATALLPLCAAWAGPAAAQGSVVTTYERIAEGGTGLTFREVGLASINQSGVVAFEGQDSGRLTGIYTSPGSAIFTTIASPSISGPSGFQPSALSINGSGTVVFSVFDQAFNATKVYAGNGGALTWVSDPATAPGLSNFIPYASFAAINDAGVVEYGATSFNAATGVSGYYVGIAQSGAFTPAIATTVPGTLNGLAFNNFTSGDINNAGQVAYSFNSTANRGYVFRRNSDGTTTTIATDIQPQTTIGLNESGFVTYTGLNNRSLLVGNGLTTTTIVDGTTLDPVTGLPIVFNANFAGGSSDYISLNNRNQVAFRGGGGNGMAPDGIYVGDGNKIVTVAQVGGALFGSIITGVTLSSQAINDAGQVVFTASLANGRTEIVRGTLPGNVSASAPEPGTLSLIAVLLVPIVSRIRSAKGM